ncbi:uncharacterized protein LOC107982108 isoform X2 [Nasonia vitripennis]|uniref:Uncharacterized protein n=1 Tax=Nasonia vitripennis TaxID=7425 RepID=A0A7M7QIH4_NASVI|nr:uncharacterized protein LOC107982108 isoform X2 [Nasonia vitripennis]
MNPKLVINYAQAIAVKILITTQMILKKNKFPYKYKAWKCIRSGINDANKMTTIERSNCQVKLRLTLPKKEEGKEQGKMKISILHLIHNHLPEHDIPGVNESRAAQVENTLENNAAKHEQATINQENLITGCTELSKVVSAEAGCTGPSKAVSAEAGCTGPSKAVSAKALNDQKEKAEAKKQLEMVMIFTSLDTLIQSKNNNLAAIKNKI